MLVKLTQLPIGFSSIGVTSARHFSLDSKLCKNITNDVTTALLISGRKCLLRNSEAEKSPSFYIHVLMHTAASKFPARDLTSFHLLLMVSLCAYMHGSHLSSTVRNLILALIPPMSGSNATDSFLDSLQLSLRNDDEQDPKKRRLSPIEDAETCVTFGFTEINKYEHCARTIQKHIRSIITGAPSIEELKEISKDKAVDQLVKQEMEANAMLHLVAKLKSLYNADKLPLFDEILENDFKENSIPTGGIGPIALKSEGEEKAEQHQLGSKARQTGLPTLPEIKNPQLRLRVFQHKSLSTHKTYLAESEIVLAHNERVEFLGDSVLNTMVTYILYDRFPTLLEGQLSQLRALLVNNRTLAEFSLNYGFDKELRCNIDESALGTGNQKIYADVFEAYLGALAMERGYDLQEVQDWLASLMEPKLVAFEIENKKVAPINRDAKTELYSLVGSAASHPVYKITKNGNGLREPFQVQCVIGDVVLGEGVAPNFRDAGIRAAMAALKNKQMLEKFGRQRLETDRSDLVKKPVDLSKEDINGVCLPFVADESVYPSKLAKNEVYTHFGKTYGIIPEYRASYDENEKRYKAELLVGDKVISVAYDALKKNAMSRAAMMILKNQSALHEIISMLI